MKYFIKIEKNRKFVLTALKEKDENVKWKKNIANTMTPLGTSQSFLNQSQFTVLHLIATAVRKTDHYQMNYAWVEVVQELCTNINKFL